MESIITFLVKALPIFLSNTSPVWLFKLFPSLNAPVDFGIKFKDGRRLFGKNKTWRGFIGGILIGSLTGFLPYISFLSAFLLSLGTLTGDLVTSFTKRRLKLKPGQKFWPETVFYVIVALIFVPGLFSPLEMLAIISLSAVLHPTLNFLGYKLKLKNVPW